MILEESGLQGNWSRFSTFLISIAQVHTYHDRVVGVNFWPKGLFESLTLKNTLLLLFFAYDVLPACM